MRSKKAFLNILAALIELFATTITSFIVPNYIIRAYGSNVNGLISSITQFLSYIALIESGIGAIGRASLYKPLAEHDIRVLSGNAKAIEDFFRKVSYIFLAYAAMLAILFPLIVNQEFEWAYTATLVLILAFSTFIQYYFGITHQTIIQADQRKYIPSLLQALTLTLNMLVTILLIKKGAGIHAVKIGSAAVYAIRPMVLYFYVRKYYKIDRTVPARSEVLKQRWDGLAQHIAFFIHKNTDIAVLTILTNVREVSVYSVYMLAVSGCSKVVNIFSASLEPAFGNMIAKGEIGTMRKRVRLCSTLTVQATIILFSTAAIAVSPFIRLYTRGVTDVKYLRPGFGIVMLIAEAFYCIRLPYQAVVYAAGHFKQTRNGAIIEAGTNIILSIALVFRFGLIGVAVGTLVSMLFRTIQYIWYYHAKILAGKEGIGSEIKKAAVYALEVFLIAILARYLPEVSSSGYGMWILSSCAVGMVCALVSVSISFLFFREELTEMLALIRRLLRRKKTG